MKKIIKRICKKHGETDYRLEKRGWYRCVKCSSEWVIKHRRAKKRKLVDFFGGKCIKCGYKKCYDSLAFHHREPEKKKFALSVKGLSYSWEKILEEAKKCDLLCKNCHTEEHSQK